jgi:hypothetical protein
MLATRSPTPWPFTAQPNCRWAATLSPSVTATWRMLSPKRASRRRWLSDHAQAARIHTSRAAWTASSSQCPTTTLRFKRRRLQMNPNSRSPWAAWFRFMKSMSMVAHGRSRLNWVWRWTKGLRSAVSPAIHILAGEKVCIHRTSPTQAGEMLASPSSPRTSSGVLTTGFSTTRQGTRGDRSRVAAIVREFSATWLSVSGP